MRSRGEQFLNALETGDASLLPEPITREDMYMYALITNKTDDLPTPVTIEEHYLHASAMNAETSALRVPITREDVYLHGLAKKDVDSLPTDITLEERFIRAAIAFLGADTEEPVDPPVDPPEEEPEDPADSLSRTRETFAKLVNYPGAWSADQGSIDYFIDSRFSGNSLFFVVTMDGGSTVYPMTTIGTSFDVNETTGIITSDKTLYTCEIGGSGGVRGTIADFSGSLPLKLVETFTR